MLLLAIFFGAVAQEIPRSIYALCAAEEDRVVRLACFDALSDEVNINPVQPVPQDNSKWSIREEVSEFDDSKSVFASIAANEIISSDISRTYRPSMTLRCMEGRVAALVHYEIFFRYKRNIFRHSFR